MVNCFISIKKYHPVYLKYLLTLLFRPQDFNQVFLLIVKLRMVLLVKQLQLKNKDLFAKFLLELSYMGQ